MMKTKRRIGIVPSLSVLSLMLVITGAPLSSTTTRIENAGAPQTPIQFINYPRPPDFPMFVTSELRQSCLAHGLQEDCGGEPSIGLNPATGNMMLQMMLTTARVHWDDSQNPPAATWQNVSNTAFRNTGDPILWVDRGTGRTFAGQLRGSLGGSQIAFTGDDGATWHELTLVQTPNPDKPTLGTGPYHEPVPPGAGVLYPNAVYYCVADSSGPPSNFYVTSASYCRRSDDGGVTWGPPKLVNTVQSDCWPFHGNVVVGPDGSVYLPNPLCGGQQGVFVSRDNGGTWTLKKVPHTFSGDRNFFRYPKAAVDAAGRLYFVSSSNGKPLVVTSDDGGEHWAQPVDVGRTFAIKATEFPVVVGGDAGRAAFAFLGTTSQGQSESKNFLGVWHLYVAQTFDGGATWETIDVTPNDPVQRGCIGFLSTCDKRNLLDFVDMTVDAEGRVLIAYTDGCISQSCVGPNGSSDDSRDSSYAIARQSSGRRLFAAFDGQ
jgi:hypothetical protein